MGQGVGALKRGEEGWNPLTNYGDCFNKLKMLLLLIMVLAFVIQILLNVHVLVFI